MDYIFNSLKKSIRLLKTDYLYIVSFIFCFAFILYKCRFGFGNIDEAFYLTIPHRLVNGAGLFAEEYHLSQMSSFLLYPIYALYLSIFKTTDGILLSFRYIFTVLHACTALFIYVRLRKINVASVVISLIYLLYTPFGIMALSYNSMGIAFLVISSVLLYTSNGKLSTYFISGLAFAASVLCCPYLILLYIYYFAIVLIRCIKQKVFLKLEQSKSFIAFTIGCFTLSVVFFAFVFSRASLKEILDAFPLIFSDPEHPSKSFSEILTDYRDGFFSVELNKYAVTLLHICFILLFTSGFWKKSKKRMIAFLTIGIFLTVLYAISFFATRVYLNFFIFPFVIIGAFSFVLFPQENLKEFLYFYLPGLIYGFCICCTSNQGFYVISTASLVSLIGSCIMFVKTANRLLGGNKLYKALMTAFFIFFILTIGVVRYNSLFWENGNMAEMTERIEVGVNKGIYTVNELKDNYTKYYNQMEFVRNYNGEKVLYFSTQTQLYLEDEKYNASYSAWISGLNQNSSDRLLKYYQLDESRLPDIVYCDLNDYNADYSVFKYFMEKGYTLKQDAFAYYFIK